MLVTSLLRCVQAWKKWSTCCPISTDTCSTPPEADWWHHWPHIRALSTPFFCCATSEGRLGFRQWTGLGLILASVNGMWQRGGVPMLSVALSWGQAWAGLVRTRDHTGQRWVVSAAVILEQPALANLLAEHRSVSGLSHTGCVAQSIEPLSLPVDLWTIMRGYCCTSLRF